MGKKYNQYSYYLKRDWERELGNKYIDNVIVTLEPQHTPS